MQELRYGTCIDPIKLGRWHVFLHNHAACNNTGSYELNADFSNDSGIEIDFLNLLGGAAPNSWIVAITLGINGDMFKWRSDTVPYQQGPFTLSIPFAEFQSLTTGMPPTETELEGVDGIVVSMGNNGNFCCTKDIALGEVRTVSNKVDVDIDISPNKLNVKNQGVLPATIFGTEDFDVTDVDPVSIRLAGVAPHRTAIEDVDEDGFDDLTLKFDRQELVQAIEDILGEDVEDGEEIILSLTGNLLDGTEIEGEDDVIILKKGKGKK